MKWYGSVMHVLLYQRRRRRSCRCCAQIKKRKRRGDRSLLTLGSPDPFAHVCATPPAPQPEESLSTWWRRLTCQLGLADVINTACPWSNDLVAPTSLALYRGHVVGFCNPGCRDKFVAAASVFDDHIRSLSQGRCVSVCQALPDAASDRVDALPHS